MDMRGWLLIPAGGINLEGVMWKGGPIEIGDSAWYNKLRGAGADVLVEAEFDAELAARENAARGKTAKPAAVKPGRRTLAAVKPEDVSRTGTPGVSPGVTPVAPVFPPVFPFDVELGDAPIAVVDDAPVDAVIVDAPKVPKAPRVKRVKIS